MSEETEHNAIRVDRRPEDGWVCYTAENPPSADNIDPNLMRMVNRASGYYHTLGVQQTNGTES